MQIIKREGGFCKVEEGMSVPLLATWPAMGEREKEIFWWRLVGLCGVGFLEKDWNLGKWKSLWLWGRKEIKEKEKGKKLEKGRYFIGSESENNGSGGFPGLSRGSGNLSGKYRNRPKFKYLGTTRNKYQKSIILY